MTDDRQHSRLGGSKAHRWMKCAGSAWAEHYAPKSPESDAAQEGTAAHEIAAEVFPADKVERDNWLGVRVRGVKVDNGMLDAIDVYCQWRSEVIAPEDEVWIERKLDFAKLPGISDELAAEMFGSADFVRYRPSDKSLVVGDYKHGAGVYVGVEDNEQLRYYALGALLALPEGYAVREVTIAIIQPRKGAEPVRTETFFAVDLLDWGQDMLLAAEATLPEDAPRKAGGHCSWCAAAATCAALRDHGAAGLSAVEKMGQLPKPDELPLDEVADFLNRIEQFEKAFNLWAKPFRDAAFRTLEKGGVIPGWKLVPKRATRKFPAEAEADVEAVLGADAYDRSLVSPAQAEKIMGKAAFKASPLAELVVAESSGYNMVPESDSRPGLTGKLGAQAIGFDD